MKVYVCETYEDLSKKAFNEVKKTLDENPSAILGLATGSSPEGLYKEMVSDHQKNGTSYKDVKSYNLDEYVGIDENDPQSYHTFMNEHLFNDIDIDKKNIHVPSGSTQADADAYEKELSQITIDLQVLGIGCNGHIGFNEPGTSFDELTHIVDLTENTRQANSRFFDNDINKVPKQAMSMGIGSIMRSKKIIVLASGANKANAVKAMVEGPVTENVPASILQRHDNVVVIVDKEAGSVLTK